MASAESKSSRNERLLILLLRSAAALRVFRTALCSPKFRPTVTNATVFREFFSQLGADHFALVLGPVISRNDFEGLGGENRLDALNERSNRATAVVDGNH